MVDSHDTECGTELFKNSDSATITADAAFQNVTKKKDTFFLTFSVITACVLTLDSGAFQVWTSPVLPQLKSNNTSINPIGRPITAFETSLLAGMPIFIGLLGSLFAGVVADKIGRKKTMIFVALVSVIGGIITAFCNNLVVYILMRVIMAVSQIATLALVPLYIIEICEEHNGAKYGCIMGASMPLGHLYSFFFGSITQVTAYTLICTAPLVPFLIAAFTVLPETPRYLLSKGKAKSTVDVLKKLRSNKSIKEIEDDYEKLKTSYKVRQMSEKGNILTIFKTKIYRKALGLAVLPLLVQHLSGVSVLMQFMSPIFNEAGTSLSGNTISVLAGVTKITVFFIAAMIIERIGRRPLLITSGYGTSITLLLLGLFFYCRYTKWEHVNQILWLPILCLILYLVLYSIGLGPIPMAIMSELFPNNLKTLAITLVISLNGILVGALNFLFPLMTESFGTHASLWFFSASSFAGTTLLYFFLPDIKGKTFEEIQQILAK